MMAFFFKYNLTVIDGCSHAENEYVVLSLVYW